MTSYTPYILASYILAALALLWVITYVSLRLASAQARSEAEQKAAQGQHGSRPRIKSILAPVSKRLKFLLPLIILVLIAGLAGIRLLEKSDSHSLFVGSLRPVPSLSVQPLIDTDPPLIWPVTGTNTMRLVNFWASWCAPCALEHPLLMELATRLHVPIDGLVYKDSPQNARFALAQNGNPYARSGLDPMGDAGLAFGIIGVPETFLIDANNQIIKTYRGPLDRKALREIEDALQ